MRSGARIVTRTCEPSSQSKVTAASVFAALLTGPIGSRPCTMSCASAPVEQRTIAKQQRERRDLFMAIFHKNSKLGDRRSDSQFILINQSCQSSEIGRAHV